MLHKCYTFLQDTNLFCAIQFCISLFLTHISQCRFSVLKAKRTNYEKICKRKTLPCIALHNVISGNQGYCKTLNICSIKFSRISENDILACFNFGGHDIPCLQTVKKKKKKIVVNLQHIFLKFSMKLCIMLSIRMDSFFIWASLRPCI